jgi:drug/metabolite transporter (DMT)-like permease
VADRRRALALAAVFLFLAFRAARVRPTASLLGAAAAYAGTVLLFSIANKLTTSANAIFIQDTAPLWVVLLSPLLLHERPTRGELLSIPVYGLGLALFFLDELSPGQLAGNFVALASGVCFALCIVTLRRIGDAAVAAIAWGNVLAALVALPMWTTGPAPEARDLAILLYLGVFQLGAAYALFARGVQHTPAVEASLLVLLEPVLNPIWAFFLAGERPGPWAIAGARGGFRPRRPGAGAVGHRRRGDRARGDRGADGMGGDERAARGGRLRPDGDAVTSRGWRAPRRAPPSAARSRRAASRRAGRRRRRRPRRARAPRRGRR